MRRDLTLGVGYLKNGFVELEGVTTLEQLDALRSNGTCVIFSSSSGLNILGHAQYSEVACFELTFSRGWPIYMQLEYCHNKTVYARINWNGNSGWGEWHRTI